MSKILLIDVDSKIPNLALMKLSAFHKATGDSVSFLALKYSGYPHKRKPTVIDGRDYDFTYSSTVFTRNKNMLRVEGCESSNGGSGVSLALELPAEIDAVAPNYDIYPGNKKSYGFITRGCIRNCKFCFVPEKEGKLRFYRGIDQIVRHRSAVFLDNNFLAYEKANGVLQELVDRRIRCQFNQGLDIRLIDNENVKLLSQMNYDGEYIFAFDNIRYLSILERKLPILKRHIEKDWKIKMFVLVGYDSDIADDIFRIEWLREHKCLPYIMRHEKCWENKNFYADMAAYCNQPGLFKKMSFDEFMKKRTNNVQRVKESIAIWRKNNARSTFLDS